MDINPDTLTLALALTGAGVTVFSALVTGLVQLLKSIFPSFVTGKERVLAFSLSAVLVILAYLSETLLANPTVSITIVGAFTAFLAWYGIARLSIAHYDDATSQVNSLRGPTVNSTSSIASTSRTEAEVGTPPPNRGNGV